VGDSLCDRVRSNLADLMVKNETLLVENKLKMKLMKDWEVDK